MAARQGLKLCKSRRRDPYALDYGCYILVDASRNWVVFGSTNDSAYDATLDQVEDVLQSGGLKS